MINNKITKVFTVTLVLSSIMIFTALSSGKSVAINDNNKKIDASALIIPTKEDVLSNGYPINESGQTYGPEYGLEPGPELQLAEGANGVRGYVYREKGASSLSEALEYTPPKSAPLFLHDGKTIIGTFYYDPADNP